MRKRVERTPGQRAAFRKKLSTPVGALFLALSVIGLVASILWGSQFIRGLFDNSAERERYENFIRPVVMMDPVPFQKPEDIPEELLLQSAMWATLMGENRGAYATDENGLLLIPTSDMDIAAAKLFGPNVELEHESFDDNDGSYLFDPEISAYRVPYIAKIAYTPRVEEIRKNGKNITLLVGYVAPGNIIWSNETAGGAKVGEMVEKKMLYDLVARDRTYYIGAVRDMDENALPMS